MKVYEKEQYAQDLLDGKLYLNRLSYFKKIEEELEANRNDGNEGVLGWFQPGKGQFIINGYEIPQEDLSGPISVQLNSYNNLNVFCVHAAHSGEFQTLTQESLPAFKKHLQISDECLKLGNYAVIIRNVGEFVLRIKQAVQRNGYIVSSKLVDYYNPKEFHGSFYENDAVFKKRDEYKHQSEYRFCINTGTIGENAIILEIGNIRDIAEICKPSGINNSFEIKLHQ